MTIDAVVTHHTDGFRSGVARFNELLAEWLKVPVLGLREGDAISASLPLLSFKLSELDPQLEASVVELAVDGRSWEIFLHELVGSELEEHLIRGARRVHAGNSEIAGEARRLNDRTEDLWTPGLLNDDRTFPDVELTVFSFGMAHKIRTDMFRRLRALLDASGKSYAVYASAANHESVSLRDSESVFAELHEIFPEELFFLGNLSDVAVADWVRRATFFAAFFTPAVRANNTSVASAMERGAVVITNLDGFSPAEYEHGTTVLDISRCEALPHEADVLARIGSSAAAATAGRGWPALIARLAGREAGLRRDGG